LQIRFYSISRNTHGFENVTLTTQNSLIEYAIDQG